MTLTWRAWSGAAGVGLIAVLAVVVLPVGSPVAAAVAVIAGVAAAVASGLFARQTPSGLRSVWWPIWAFLAVTVLADALYYGLRMAAAEPTFPNWLDGLYLTAYIAGIAGLASLARKRSPRRDVTTWIDSIIVTLAVGSLSAILVVGPALQSAQVLDASAVVGLAYPMLDVLMLVVLANVVLGRWRRNASLLWLASGIATYLVADFAFNLTVASGDAPSSTILDALYLTGSVAIALAIMAPDARTVDERADEDDGHLSVNRLVVLTGSAIAVPVAGLALDTTEQHALSRAVSIASVGIVVLLMVRVLLLLRMTTAQSRILATQARVDALTGLPNRRTWDHQLERAAREANRPGASLAVAMIDLDFFKNYNDRNGHQAGDRILVQAARAWAVEMEGHGFLARYGGEEFCALLPGPTLQGALAVLERVRSATPEPLTASVGVALLEPGESGSDAVRRADMALYAAKSAGRNKVMVADSHQATTGVFTVTAPPPSADAPLVGAENLLRLMLDHASDIVYRTSGLEVAWISPSVTKHLGWEPDELIGGPASALVSPNQDLGWIEANRQRLLDGETVYQELLLTTKGGQERWFGGTAHPNLVEGKVVGFIVAMNDIHSRWLARTELDSLEELVRVASATAQHGVAFLDGEGRVIEVNQAMRDFLGLASTELVGHRWVSFVHPEDSRFEREMMERLTSGSLDSYRLTSRYLRPDGRIVRGEVSAATVRGTDRQPGRIIMQVIDVSEEMASRDRLAELGRTDVATGLLSRTGVLNELDVRIHALPGADDVVGVVLIEISNLGIVNESLGHQAGDVVVREVAERLSAAAPSGSLLGRSGKRFMMIVDSCSTDELLEVARFVGAAVEAEVSVEGRRVTPLPLVGVVRGGPDSDALTILRNGHIALSEARRGSGSAPVLFEPSLAASLEQRLAIEEDMREGLLRGQFVLEYQPVVRLSSGVIESFEALVRWQHPSGGTWPPADFLPIAEESKLIRHLGQWVLRQVCADLQAHPGTLRHVAVNVSAVEIEADDWLSETLQIIHASGIDPTRLCIEVTETAVFSVSRDVTAEFEALRALGIGIVMDDFGTGYSSLSLLRDLPVTGVKLDRSFVTDMDEAEGPESALASALIGLADALALTGVAEGIETPLQAVRLRSMGWHFGQGYLFGRPAPLSHWVSGAAVGAYGSWSSSSS